MRLLIVQGHPDPAGGHLGHALAQAYAAGAGQGGHEVRTLAVARLDFPLLRTRQEWDDGEPAPDIREAQASIAWAEHLVLVYPLWLGSMPALLKGFLEQALRPGFAVGPFGARQQKLLRGRSARVVVTMGMPGLFYRWYFGAHSLKSLERNILRFCGIAPVSQTLVGRVDGMSEARRTRWLARLHAWGRAGR